MHNDIRNEENIRTKIRKTKIKDLKKLKISIRRNINYNRNSNLII